MVNPAPTLHGAMMYSGTGHLTIIASPLSEIAYQLAGGVGGAGADLTQAIDYQNKVATAFGLDGIDIITTIPTDLNDDIARNDDSGKFGLVLAGVSQVGENSGESPMETIEHLVNDMNGTDGSNVDTIEGRLAFSETVDMLTAIDNFKASGGDNNLDNGEGSGHTGAAGSAIGQGSVSGNLSILKISLYEGISGTEPTLQDYTNAGISGVNAGNLTQVNARLATATTDDSDTTTKIQDLVNTTSGVANHDNSTLSASPASVPADGTTFATITLQAKDFNGDDLTTGGLSVSLTHNGSSGVNIPALMTDNADGTYSATITNTTAELVRINATISGSGVTNTVEVTFTPGTASAANSILNASPTSVPADGVATATITLQAKDAYGNNLTTGGLTVNMTSASSSVNIYSVMIDNGDGTYSATITSTTTADTLVISADFGGNPVANTVYVTFTGAATAANSTLSASPTSVPADSSTIVTITLQAKDAYGHNLTTGGLTVSITSTGSAATLSSVTDHGDDTYSATITSNSVGNVTISAGFAGQILIDTATITFTVGVASAAHSTLSASPASVPADGITPSTLTLQATDANGHNLTTGGLTVSLTHNGYSGVNLSAVMTDHQDGTYSATITNTTAEMITVRADFGGWDMTNTVGVVFTGSINLDNSTLSASATTVPADGITPSTLTLQARDANGHNLTTGGLTVSLTHNGYSGVNLSAVMTDHQDGTYSATITNTTAELVTISASLAASFVIDTVINFVNVSTESDASAAQSTLNASPTSVLADGITPATLTLQAKNSTGLYLTTGGLTVSITHNSSTAILSPVIDHGNGTYSATMTNTVVENVIISAEFGGNPVVDITSLSFAAASAAHSMLSASPTSVPANGRTTATITLQAKNSNGVYLQVSGLNVSMTHNSSTAILSSVIDHGDGTYRATMTNTVVENVMISAEFGGNPVVDTATITFTVGVASATRSMLSLSPASVPADGITPATLTLQVRDSNGVNFTTGGLTVSITHSSSTAILSPVIDHGDGTYSATMTNTTANESVRINAGFGGHTVSDHLGFVGPANHDINPALKYRSTPRFFLV